MTLYGEDMAISTVNYVQSTRRWYVRTSCIPQQLLVIIFPMPRKRKQQKKTGRGDGDGDDIERCFEEAFEDVVSTRCGGCGNPLAHGSHDCPFCHCLMHTWCGHSMEETHLFQLPLHLSPCKPSVMPDLRYLNNFISLIPLLTCKLATCKLAECKLAACKLATHKLATHKLATFNLQPTTHNPQPTTHNLQPATHNPQSATYATCNMQHATCNMQHKTCNMQHKTCNMKHATCNIKQAHNEHHAIILK